jgi:hypothetical protein
MQKTGMRTTERIVWLNSCVNLFNNAQATSLEFQYYVAQSNLNEDFLLVKNGHYA